MGYSQLQHQRMMLPESVVRISLILAKHPCRGAVTILGHGNESAAIVTTNSTESGLQIQHHQQPAKTNKLANHHAELNNLRVGKMLVQTFKKVVVNIVMVSGHAAGVFHSQALCWGEIVSLAIQLGDLVFCQAVFCTLQKPNIQSCKAVVGAGNLQSHQLNQGRIDSTTLACRPIELKIVGKKVRTVRQTPRQGRITSRGLNGSDLRQSRGIQFLICFQRDSSHAKSPVLGK
jgi:hypothetical protein